MPEGVCDRDADVWEALLAVADLAGGRWPTDARAAAVALVNASRNRKPSMGVLLLADIRTVFMASGGDKITSDQLLKGLGALEESPWATIRRGEPIDARGLASRLANYGIGPKAQRQGENVFRGYSLGQFVDTWERYLPPEAAPVERDISVTSVTSITTLPHRVADVTDVTDKSA